MWYHVVLEILLALSAFGLAWSEAFCYWIEFFYDWIRIYQELVDCLNDRSFISAPLTICITGHRASNVKANRANVWRPRMREREIQKYVASAKMREKSGV